jgi:hypothetical protein
MTRDDIIRMAMDAFLPITYTEALERFAALVAAAEREECAKVCEAERERLFWGHNVQAISADKLAEAIRARGNK